MRAEGLTPEEFRNSNIFPPDILEQTERHFRTYLDKVESDPIELHMNQAAKLNWKKTAEIIKDGHVAPFTKRSVRFARGNEQAVLWHKDATITLVRLN